MDFLSSLNPRNQPNWCDGAQIPPQWLDQPITIFHPQDGKSPLARLPLASWLLARHLVRAYGGAFQKSLPALPRLSLKSPHVAENWAHSKPVLGVPWRHWAASSPLPYQ